MRARIICLTIILGTVFSHFSLGLVAQPIYHTGNEGPVETNHLPGLVLAGGQTDNNDAMRWMLERADGGDVVVLRASGSDGYNNYFFSGLGVSVNSVTSIVIQNAAHANSEEVVNILNNAEVVFIAGGNQWNYVNHWRDSAVLDALNTLINEKQITIGGTSAGMAVLGEVVFTAENATVWSSEALSDPYHWRVKLEKDFLDVPYMQNTVTDSHYNREEGDGNDRKGRHVAFMARMIADWDMPARGIAANEYTAIAVDENGKARVFGHPNYPDYGYFLQVFGGVPEVCEQGESLSWNRDAQALRVYKVKGDFNGSSWFDLASWVNGNGGEWQYWHVGAGVLSESESFEPDDLWLQLRVYAADGITHLEGAEVFLEGQPAQTTPVYGAVNFLHLDDNVSLDYQVVRDGHLTTHGVVDLGEENKMLEVVLLDDDTFIPVVPLADQAILLYPNPAEDVLTVTIDGGHVRPDGKSALFRILKIDGTVIHTTRPAATATDSSQNMSYSINIEHLSPGIYILEIDDGGHRTARRWVKQ